MLRESPYLATGLPQLVFDVRGAFFAPSFPFIVHEQPCFWVFLFNLLSLAWLGERMCRFLSATPVKDFESVLKACIDRPLRVYIGRHGLLAEQGLELPQLLHLLLLVHRLVVRARVAV